MPSEPEAHSEVRPVPARKSPEAGVDSKAPRAPLLYDGGALHSRRGTRVLIAVVAALLLALLAYELFFAPSAEPPAWTPPAGLQAAETPPWLQTLCADATPELCAAADGARTATDCESMRTALRALEATQKRLSARGVMSSPQHWVLLELYGQGHQLCQFEPAEQTRPAAK